MSFTIQNLDTREGIPGLVIGTLVGQQGDVFTPFFNYGGAIVLEENQLKLGPDYFFDFDLFLWCWSWCFGWSVGRCCDMSCSLRWTFGWSMFWNS